MSLISKIPPNPFTLSAVIVAYAIIPDLTVNEQDSIGNWFQLLGQTLETYSTQITTNNQTNITQNNNENNNMEKIEKVLKKMQEEIIKIKAGD